MALHPVREWFGAKRIGWGISPHTWEGWVATFAIAAALIVVFTWVT